MRNKFYEFYVFHDRRQYVMLTSTCTPRVRSLCSMPWDTKQIRLNSTSVAVCHRNTAATLTESSLTHFVLHRIPVCLHCTSQSERSSCAAFSSVHFHQLHLRICLCSICQLKLRICVCSIFVSQLYMIQLDLIQLLCQQPNTKFRTLTISQYIIKINLKNIHSNNQFTLF